MALCRGQEREIFLVRRKSLENDGGCFGELDKGCFEVACLMVGPARLAESIGCFEPLFQAL